MAFCAGSATALASNAWTISSAELELNIIELSDEGMGIINSMTPFNQPVYLHGNSWRHYASSLAASTAGNYSTLVPARFASLKSICVPPRRSTEANAQQAYSLSSRINPGIQNYFLGLVHTFYQIKVLLYKIQVPLMDMQKRLQSYKGLFTV